MSNDPNNHQTSEEERKKVRLYGRGEMFGRRMILTSKDEITPENVVEVVEQAYQVHLLNREEIDYLWEYYKGKQPSLYRTRELRDELTKRLCENRANQIVTFETGYVVGKPIQYIASVEGEEVSKSVAALNDAMRLIGKRTKDKQLVEWCKIGGVGYRYVVQNKDKALKTKFNLHTLDPRYTFVIRRNDYSRAVIAGVNYVTDDNGQTTFTVYTDKYVFTFKHDTRNPITKRNAFGAIPIIEYPANSARLGSFEVVLTMLDAINDFDCARNEAVEQFVQSLLVLYNCQIEEGTTADTIRQAGMILLKSIGDNKADVKNLSEELDQSQNQTLKDDMWQTVLQIVGMPSQGDGSTGDSSNNGAVVLKNGWQGAETKAQDFEAEFNLPEMEMLRVVSVLCKGISGGFNFDPANVDIKFRRQPYDNLLSKSQTLTTMLGNDKIHPRSAYEASGLFTDVEEAYQLGMSWYNKVREELNKQNGTAKPGDKVQVTADE